MAQHPLGCNRDRLLARLVTDVVLWRPAWLASEFTTSRENRIVGTGVYRPVIRANGEGKAILAMLAAHSVNGNGVRHPLEDHLRETARLAREFAEPFGAGELAAYLGLVHDVGKASCAWQQRLTAVEDSGGRVGIDHKMAGTWLASQAVGEFAIAVNGHHGGLPASAQLKNELRAAATSGQAEWADVIEKVAALVPEIKPATQPTFPRWLDGTRFRDRAVTDLLMRMVFSALVDADFLDTAEHFRPCLTVAGHGGKPDPTALRPHLSAADLAGRYERRRSAFVAGVVPSPADGLRREVYAQAIAAAAGPTGMYRLPAPTGSGKTLAAGGFALRHAQAHGLRQVVVAVPFISITEQNADIYRRLLDVAGEPPVVLEHHSSVDLDSHANDASGHWRKLASENWDAPFVVTTTVQLFQSLFDHRPAAMRKLHRLARSVIVLDEVQALPDRLLIPILSVLRLLTECFGTTVLLASATQPSYWSLAPFGELPVTDVIADPSGLYASFRRVRWDWQLEPRPNLAQIAEQVAQEPQALVVVNTTANSAALHQELEDRRDDSLGPCLHLSTRMAARHRRDVLGEIRERLAAGNPVAVVSTQLIEAGVDLDFPVVFRAWAPADSLQQAAGRCNRSARLQEGRVVIFDPEDGGHPADSSYKAALHATASWFGADLAEPDDLTALDGYYPERYTRQNLEVSGDGARIQRLCCHLDFPEVAKAFQMIEDHTVPVAVEYGSQQAITEMHELADRLRNPESLRTGEAALLLRRIQPYLAALPKPLASKALTAGCAEPIIGDLLQWHGPYHPRRGIDPAALSDPSSTEVYVW
jgi:CRISPR-associated endonuclease/helicase Cas3